MFDSSCKWKLLYPLVVKSKEDLFTVLCNNRNISDPKKFFANALDLYDPYLFNDMEKCVERIGKAIENQEKIMIYGDYDGDGVTATAILYKTLKRLGGNVHFYIPNRFLEGYGPNLDAFSDIIKDGFSLIITVDCGITGLTEGKYVNDSVCDLIITDHHEIQDEIPLAYAILHPKLPTENYPFKDLSGCGVAFKLAQALLGEDALELIDLAALGTYSDMVSLHDENRSIVKWGLNQLKNTNHLGLRLLIQTLNLKKLNEYALGFVIGPRLNAPGRMDTGNLAVKLLVTEDYEEAIRLVHEIEALNDNRKLTIESSINEAVEIIEKEGLNQYNVLVVEGDNFHEGVLGIICNKLVALYHKPAIVLTESQGIYKGSCRSVDDFPLVENLTKCSDLLEQFGGHKLAAGLSIKKENIPLLRERLHELGQGEVWRWVNIDCELDVSLVSLGLTQELQKFRPFGMNNENPLFLLTDCEVYALTPVGGDKHLKIVLRKDGRIIEGIAFNKGNLYYNISIHDLIDVVGTFDINEYNGTVTNQLTIEDICCKHRQIFDCRHKAWDYENVFKDKQFIYFVNDYGFTNAYKFSPDLTLSKDVVLIDLPESITDLKYILKQKDIHNLYLIFRNEDLFSSEHLLTRDKLGKFYQILKKVESFPINDSQTEALFTKMGFSKRLQMISLQVFFELNFVIIKDNKIVVVESPERKNLTDSETYRRVIEQVELREKLLLSSNEEFIKYINSLMEE
ncbi:MAG: single-stranded-DNA-specific exonuclease RecJ [Bacilli bacterium]|nr:single-stranded-DNA-specific exonuclease RecJ [Bacilli bacterium]